MNSQRLLRCASLSDEGPVENNETFDFEFASTCSMKTKAAPLASFKVANTSTFRFACHTSRGMAKEMEP